MLQLLPLQPATFVTPVVEKVLDEFSHATQKVWFAPRIKEYSQAAMAVSQQVVRDCNVMARAANKKYSPRVYTKSNTILIA